MKGLFWLMLAGLLAMFLFAGCGGEGGGDNDDDDNDNDDVSDNDDGSGDGDLWGLPLGCEGAKKIICDCESFKEWGKEMLEQIRQDTGEEIEDDYFCKNFEDVFTTETMCNDLIGRWAWECSNCGSHPSFGSLQTKIEYGKVGEFCSEFGVEACSLDRQNILECSEVDGKWHIHYRCERSKDDWEICVAEIRSCADDDDFDKEDCIVAEYPDRCDCKSAPWCFNEGELRHEPYDEDTIDTCDGKQIECKYDLYFDILRWIPDPDCPK